MNNSSRDLACPLCSTRFSCSCGTDNRDALAFGCGLDFRLVSRDCNRSSDIATCPNCFFTARVKDYHKPVPGQVKDLIRSDEYLDIFRGYPDQEIPARAWLALIEVLDVRRASPRDMAIMSLRGSWVARELGSLGTEEELLGCADACLEDALRRGLNKGDPGMSMYLLGEINRRRREFRRAREVLTFLGNNPRFRYPALLLTVLIEEEDSTPYWSLHSPDQMEKHSSRFNGLFPALRSIPPKKVEFSADELTQQHHEPGEDDSKRF